MTPRPSRAPERSPGEILGYSLAALTALALVGLLVLVATPAASGCGSRRVGVDEPAVAPQPAPAAARAGGEVAPPAAATAGSGESTDGSSGTDSVPSTAAAAIAAPPVPSPPRASPLEGDYECRFTRGDRELAPVPCAIRAASDGALRIEQTGGAVRLDGTVTEDDAGFRLSGQVTCAAGLCPGPGVRDIVFFNQGPRAYSAVLLLRGGQFLNIDLVRKD